MTSSKDRRASSLLGAHLCAKQARLLAKVASSTKVRTFVKPGHKGKLPKRSAQLCRVLTGIPFLTSVEEVARSANNSARPPPTQRHGSHAETEAAWDRLSSTKTLGVQTHRTPLGTNLHSTRRWTPSRPVHQVRVIITLTPLACMWIPQRRLRKVTTCVTKPPLVAILSPRPLCPTDTAWYSTRSEVCTQRRPRHRFVRHHCKSSPKVIIEVWFPSYWKLLTRCRASLGLPIRLSRL